MQKSYNIMVSFPSISWKVFSYLEAETDSCLHQTLTDHLKALVFSQERFLKVLLKKKPFWNIQVRQINHFNDPKLILCCQFNK